jgi:hypothetical protein
LVEEAVAEAADLAAVAAELRFAVVEALDQAVADLAAARVPAADMLGGRLRCRAPAAVAAGLRSMFLVAGGKEWEIFPRPAAGQVADKLRVPAAAALGQAVDRLVDLAVGRLHDREVAADDQAAATSRADDRRSATSITS